MLAIALSTCQPNPFWDNWCRLKADIANTPPTKKMPEKNAEDFRREESSIVFTFIAKYKKNKVYAKTHISTESLLNPINKNTRIK